MHPDYRSAESFCKNIQVEGNAEWKHVGLGGWFVSAIGAAGTGALTGLAAKSDDKGQAAAFSGGAALSAVVTALGVYMITQAANGRRASVDAASIPLDGALSEDNKWKKCMTVLKTWGDTSADAAVKAAAALGEAGKPSGKKDDEKKNDEKDNTKKDEKDGAKRRARRMGKLHSPRVNRDRSSLTGRNNVSHDAAAQLRLGSDAWARVARPRAAQPQVVGPRGCRSCGTGATAAGR